MNIKRVEIKVRKEMNTFVRIIWDVFGRAEWHISYILKISFWLLCQNRVTEKRQKKGDQVTLF